jgi:adenylate cyclase
VRFRIGIHIGDIHEKVDGSIYGDGVNVAARLQTIAEPGAVIVSDGVRGALRGRLDVGFSDAGSHEVKNVAEPVHAYRVIEAGPNPEGMMSSRRRLIASVIGTMALLLAAAATTWWFAQEFIYPSHETVSGDAENDPVLAIPTGPTIAVLPFDNLSGDAEQDYFVDGLTEEIIAALSRFSQLSVISRNSTFRYKGQAVDVPTVGKELGARYLVEGSIRRAANTIRVTAQLIDVETDSHLWSETFERALTAENVFQIQDEVTSRIAATIGDLYGVIAMANTTDNTRDHKVSLDGYDCVLRALDRVRWLRPEYHAPARDCLERTVEEEPEYALAWAWLAYMYVEEYSQGLNTLPGSLDRALNAAERAVRLSPNDSQVYIALANAHFFRGEREAFVGAAERALFLNPNDAGVVALMGHRLAYVGQWQRGMALLEKAKIMNPYHPGWYHFVPFFDRYSAGDYEAALAIAQKMNLHDYVWTQAAIVAAYGQLDRKDDAAPFVARILELKPQFETTARADRWKIFRYQEELLDHFMAGLRKAGLNVETGDKVQ